MLSQRINILEGCRILLLPRHDLMYGCVSAWTAVGWRWKVGSKQGARA